VEQIFLHDVGHCHAQSGSEVLRGHRVLLLGIFQEANQTVSEIVAVSCPIKFDRQFFSLSHLPKIGKVRTNNRHSILAGEMGHAAGTGGR